MKQNDDNKEKEKDLPLRGAQPAKLKDEGAAPIDESKPVPPKFVFKITKSNPKNSLDFEDVADK
ncbi:MAG: hypothetical protein HY286_14355 [Planctomycetes bacterium]|nr:hypothetical protein [Planctomycetota bacterium]